MTLGRYPPFGYPWCEVASYQRVEERASGLRLANGQYLRSPFRAARLVRSATHAPTGQIQFG